MLCILRLILVRPAVMSSLLPPEAGEQKKTTVTTVGLTGVFPPQTQGATMSPFYTRKETWTSHTKVKMLDQKYSQPVCFGFIGFTRKKASMVMINWLVWQCTLTSPPPIKSSPQPLI